MTAQVKSAGAQPAFNFRCGGKLYRLDITARLVCNIEDELGPLSDLARRFHGGRWRMGDVITLMHMFLQACGESIDFYDLGDALLREGFAQPLATVQRFMTAAGLDIQPQQRIPA